MASCVPGELIPCAFVWHDPGITPCCKSPKLPGDDFLAGRRSDRRTPVCVASITLPRSPVSLSVGDEVPHILTRRSRLKPGEFSITSAKRLLQHNLPGTDSCSAVNEAHCLGGRIATFGACDDRIRNHRAEAASSFMSSSATKRDSSSCNPASGTCCSVLRSKPAP